MTQQATAPAEETTQIPLEPPGKQVAYPMPSFRWNEIDRNGTRVLQQAHRVEQNHKIVGIVWFDVPVERFKEKQANVPPVDQLAE